MCLLKGKAIAQGFFCFTALLLPLGPALAQENPSALADSTPQPKKEAKKKSKQTLPHIQQVAATTAAKPKSEFETKLAADVLKKFQAAKVLFDDMEFDEALPLIDALLLKPQAEVNVVTRIDLYYMKGCSLAIMGQQFEAEKPFRFLLSLQRDFDVPPTLSPKIVQVFKKVKAEIEAVHVQMLQLERLRTIREMEIVGKLPKTLRGGLPIEFQYTVQDPKKAVDKVLIHYKRNHEEAFSSLALSNKSKENWSGQLPGAWTSNEDGFRFDYYVQTKSNRLGSLLGRGDEIKPLNINIQPGKFIKVEILPWYKQPWFWWTTAIAATAIGGLSYWGYSEATSTTVSEGGDIAF
ncbi:MAG: hypothetical protein VYA34_14740 [Myxococcota bacterium]|nr:hypothetical protein [Myxococcota bacterium]